MPQETIETNNELDDSSANTRTNTERDRTADQSTTDYSQDVDTQERIRTNAVSSDTSKNLADVENQRRDRGQSDQIFQNALAFTQQMQAIALQGMQNMVSNAEMAKNQNMRHVDHTLIDLHGADVNPGAIPNADEGVG
jgi:hypothetical protein